MESQETDVVVIGGGPAGMNAALVLARSRKRVVVLDAEQPRHGVADGVHNFISREGIDPWELRRISRAQIMEYPGVRFEQAVVTQIEDAGALVEVKTAAGAVYRARAALLALGVRDIHPTWHGWSEVWGKTANQCPYCHGWESRDRPLAVVVSDSIIAPYAALIRGWSEDVMVFEDGHPLSAEERAKLAQANIPVKAGKIVALHQRAGQLEAIELEGGERVARQGIFRHQKQEPLELVRALNLELEGAYIKLSGMQQTSRARLWAAGDCTTQMQTVVGAMAQGMAAGASINMALTVPNHP